MLIRIVLMCVLLLGACSSEGEGATGGQNDSSDAVEDIQEPDSTEDDSVQEDAVADVQDDDAAADVQDDEVDIIDDDVAVDTVDEDTGDASVEDSQSDPDTVNQDAAADIQDEDFDNGLEPLDDIKDPGPAPEWLLSIDNGTKYLQKVDIETGKATNLCKLKGAPGSGLVIKSSYPSLTFSRSNLLFASRNGSYLDIIDPCNCEVTPVGDYGIWTGVNGITSDQGTQLMGASSSQQELISIATKTGLGTMIGKLGVQFTTHGATWSDELAGLYAINGGTDKLYIIDPTTGKATEVADLSYDFGTVGIELLPANGVIYACSSNSILLSVDPVTGQVAEIGVMGQLGTCTNLAAPWAPVICPDGTAL
ncbi:MAG TPA: hypothetical protein EYN66_06125 [Myxococcales bacterium]|nr:hypothetical protein [Myxococcales bacterium]